MQPCPLKKLRVFAFVRRIHPVTHCESVNCHMLRAVSPSYGETERVRLVHAVVFFGGSVSYKRWSLPVCLQNGALYWAACSDTKQMVLFQTCH